MGLSTVVYLVCDGPKLFAKKPENKCGKVLDKPGKGVYLYDLVIKPALAPDNTVRGEHLPGGAYCWDCLLRLLDIAKSDPECSYARDMSSLNHYIQEDRRDS